MTSINLFETTKTVVITAMLTLAFGFLTSSCATVSADDEGTDGKTFGARLAEKLNIEENLVIKAIEEVKKEMWSEHKYLEEDKIMEKAEVIERGNERIRKAIESGEDDQVIDGLRLRIWWAEIELSKDRLRFAFENGEFNEEEAGRVRQEIHAEELEFNKTRARIGSERGYREDRRRKSRDPSEEEVRERLKIAIESGQLTQEEADERLKSWIGEIKQKQQETQKKRK